VRRHGKRDEADLFFVHMSLPNPPLNNDDEPGVPYFRTWGGVYTFVFVCFVLVVILLTIFSRVYA
jgi:hypothetical protein